MAHINVEFKAICLNPDYVRKTLKDLKADFKGLDHQIDSYFNVKNGRLKLREGTIEKALIFYEREDKKGPKQSNVILYHPNSSEIALLKDILVKTYGISVIVDKKREIYFIENVKFHIDDVENLGSFVEVEAIDSDGSISLQKLQKQCQYYLELLKISKSDLVSNSYSDLLSMS